MQAALAWLLNSTRLWLSFSQGKQVKVQGVGREGRHRGGILICCMRQKCLINILIKSQVMLGACDNVCDLVSSLLMRHQREKRKTLAENSLSFCENVQPRKSQVFVQFANFGLTQKTDLYQAHAYANAKGSLCLLLLLLLLHVSLCSFLHVMWRHLALATPPCPMPMA